MVFFERAMNKQLFPMEAGEITAEWDHGQICIHSVRSDTRGCVWLTQKEAEQLQHWLENALRAESESAQ